MGRQERKFFCKVIAVCGAWIIIATYFYTLPVSAKNAPFEASDVSDDKIVEEEAKTPETGQIREDSGISGMPCENPEQFERWYETYEPQTEEERYSERAEVLEESEAECVHAESTEEVPLESEVPLYAVDGQVLNPDIQAYLYQRLAEHQLEWFMPYSIMICYQESRFDCYAVNPHNGVDCGLFQYRSYYYTGSDIFNPYEQIDIFVQQMAHRANIGCDVYEMISRHNVSDFGSYNATYVSQVMAHEQNLRKVDE